MWYHYSVTALINVFCLRYYLNGGDAFRLKLWLDSPSSEVGDVAAKVEQVEVS